jgi:hypothetical protein
MAARHAHFAVGCCWHRVGSSHSGCRHFLFNCDSGETASGCYRLTPMAAAGESKRALTETDFMII